MIAGFLYRNPRILFLFLLTVVVVGLSSAWILPRLEDPLLRQRVGVVAVRFPGANPLRIESDVARPLEQLLRTIPEIKRIRSHIRAHAANLVIELEDSVTDVQTVWSLVREKISQSSLKLPAECDTPTLEIFPLKANAAIIAIRKSPDRKLSFTTWRRIAYQLQDEILNLPGTETVKIFGDPQEEILVEVDPSKLAASHLTNGSVASQIAGQIDQKIAGNLGFEESDLLLEVNAEQQPLEQIAGTMVSSPTAEDPIRLTDLASIRIQPASPTGSSAVIDGHPAIILAVMARDSAQVDRWSGELDQVIDGFSATFSDQIEIDTLFSQSTYIQTRLNSLLLSLLLSMAGVVLCVLLLMGWRSMLVVGTALPISALMVLAGMRWLGIPLHQMSVTGLIVAMGLLIDNPIVIVEEVRGRVFRGKSITEAMSEAVQHLSMPLAGATFTTVLAFLPIASLPGPAGEFVSGIAISVILAIVSSLLLALTVIPALTGLLGIPQSASGIFQNGLHPLGLKKLFRLSLLLAFRFPTLGVLLGVALPVLGFYLARDLPLQFFPPSDRSQIQIEIEQTSSSNALAVSRAVQRAQAIIRQNPKCLKQNWFIGGSAPTFYYNVVPRRRDTPSYAQAFVETQQGIDAAALVTELQFDLDNAILDSRVVVQQLQQGPPFDAPVEVRIKGPDYAVLHDLGRQLRALLAEDPNVLHTRSDMEDTLAKLDFEVQPERAHEAGLRDDEIARFVYASIEGAPAGSVLYQGVDVPVKVKTRMKPGERLTTLSALTVPGKPPSAISGALQRTNTGSIHRNRRLPTHTLASLGDFKLTSDMAAILRVDGSRINEIKAYTRAGVLPSTVLKDFKERLQESDWILPNGYDIEIGGESEQRRDAVEKLMANGAVLFVIMLFCLVFIFRSFRSAFTIAMVGMLTVGLGPLALSVFEFPLGFMAIVGTMGLFGVAINDSIVVLAAIRGSDLSRQRETTPETLADVVLGCSRHIFTTTLTTIVGFIPLIVAGGEFWPPLAICIAGGVGGATLLALYLVPSLYRILFFRRAGKRTITAHAS